MVRVILPPEPILPAFPENNIPVFLGCNDRFFPHAVATLASLLRHASPRNNYDLFIVQEGVPPERLEKALDWVKQFPNASLRFVDIHPLIENVGRDSFIIKQAFSIATFYRVFAATIFSGYDRIVYQDSDMILFDDIADFFAMDLKGNVIGACHDYVSERQSLTNPAVTDFWRNEMDKEPGTSYFNAGVLVMDLAAMRKGEIEDKLMSKMKSINNAELPDQDILNSVLNGRIAFAEPEWNCFDWMYDAEEQSPNFLLLDDFSREEVRRARREIKILHYSEKKPWTREYFGCHAGIYWEYSKGTPFFAEEAERLARECGFWNVCLRNAVLRFQWLHFWFKSLFGSNRNKYLSRMRNIGIRLRGIASQVKLARRLNRERV